MPEDGVLVADLDEGHGGVVAPALARVGVHVGEDVGHALALEVGHVLVEEHEELGLAALGQAGHVAGLDAQVVVGVQDDVDPLLGEGGDEGVHAVEAAFAVSQDGVRLPVAETLQAVLAHDVHSQLAQALDGALQAAGAPAAAELGAPEAGRRAVREGEAVPLDLQEAVRARRRLDEARAVDGRRREVVLRRLEHEPARRHGRRDRGLLRRLRDTERCAGRGQRQHRQHHPTRALPTRHRKALRFRIKRSGTRVPIPPLSRSRRPPVRRPS